MERRPATPADCAIRALGGVRATARACHLQPGAVVFWKRFGLVPARHQRVVLLCARERGADLTAEDLVMGRDVDSDDQGA